MIFGIYCQSHMITFNHFSSNFLVNSLSVESKQTKFSQYHKSWSIHATPDIHVHQAQIKTVFLMDLFVIKLVFCVC
ncbi:MAG: hypothetical protein B6229_07190 [Spirochaetaceae bacterium 4572_7]|nr:MAG: hypothetical protein B6229_07190 [Spirochaetaceae bacterium 4572_7]